MELFIKIHGFQIVVVNGKLQASVLKGETEGSDYLKGLELENLKKLG